MTDDTVLVEEEKSAVGDTFIGDDAPALTEPGIRPLQAVVDDLISSQNSIFFERPEPDSPSDESTPESELPPE